MAPAEYFSSPWWNAPHFRHGKPRATAQSTDRSALETDDFVISGRECWFWCVDRASRSAQSARRGPLICTEYMAPSAGGTFDWQSWDGPTSGRSHRFGSTTYSIPSGRPYRELGGI